MKITLSCTGSGKSLGSLLYVDEGLIQSCRFRDQVELSVIISSASPIPEYISVSKDN